MNSWNRRRSPGTRIPAAALLMLIALALPRGTAGEAAPAPAGRPGAAARGEMPPTVMVVAGAPGEDEFLSDFEQQIGAWTEVSGRAGANFILVGRDPASQETERPKDSASPAADRQRLEQALAAEPKTGPAELWLVFIGHGTFDGREAKFNLRGPDVSATELAEWLQPFQRPLAVIDTASASAPFLAKLSGPERVIVTSTRSGYEQSYARFGKYLAEALPDPKSDLDKDGQISLLEAFLSAAHRTAEFYRADNRLATEHALVDDNGDGLGTPAEWFKGVRAVKRARDGAVPDGTRAHQFHLVRSPDEQLLSAEDRARRDRLELELVKLRDAKAKMPEDAYYRELEKVLLQIAALYEGT